jgi:ketosteroid isomerase-like protein
VKPAIVFLCFCLSTVAADSISDNQINELIQRYDAAWLKKDVAAVSETMSPEYVYFSSDGKLSDRQWMLDFLQKKSYKLDRSERSEIEIHRTGSTAVVSSRWIGTGSYDGKPINDDQRCGIVLSRVKGRWLIVSEHCTQITK